MARSAAPYLSSVHARMPCKSFKYVKYYWTTQAVARRRAAQDRLRYAMHSDELFNRLRWCLDRGLTPAHEHRHLSHGADWRFYVRAALFAAYPVTVARVLPGGVCSMASRLGCRTGLRTLQAFQTLRLTSAACRRASICSRWTQHPDAAAAGVRLSPTTFVCASAASATKSARSHKSASARPQWPGNATTSESLCAELRNNNVWWVPVVPRKTRTWP